MTEPSDTTPEPSPAKPAVVTMRDVAERAGVSVATVSLVINNKKRERIGEQTRVRVLDAVAELGYRPNAAAKSLVSGQSRFIGMVADAIATRPFAGQILRGAQEEAWRRGYVLLVADTDLVPGATEDAIRMMIDHQAVGVLFSTWYHRQVQAPPLLAALPSVFVNCYSPAPGATSIVPDEVQGGRLATELLLDRGHRRIAFINSTEDAPSTTGRLAGYEAALAAHGVDFDDALVVPIYPDDVGGFQEAGYLAGLKLLAGGDRPSAVFCYNDRAAMGLYDAAKELGLSIPGDLAVVGFDDQEVIAAHLRPKLTTIALPHYEIGVRGVRALLARIEADAPGHLETVECPAVMRASA
jgi:LacI family transcriptional regulator